MKPLPVEEAQTRLLALRAPLQSENMDFFQSIGRYLSDPVTAIRDQPSAALSAMDGFAIRFSDLPGPWSISGEVSAGSVPQAPLRAGDAMRIFTGAMLPENADTVLIQENAAMRGTTLHLTGAAPATRGANVRRRSSDFALGDLLLEAGTRLTPGAIAAAIMSGAEHLTVGRRPRVAILTTGDELVRPGHRPAPGQIPDSNGLMLAAMLAGEPAEVGLPLHTRDDGAMIGRILRELAERHDVIVTVGGASVGDHDHVVHALETAGGRVDFWKVAMKPGKPLIAGAIGDAVLLGLPGNPASAFVTATLFLLPLVRHLAGARAPLPAIRHAPLAAALGSGGSRREYLRARLDDGRLSMFDRQDSGRAAPLAHANALLIRDAEAAAKAVGEMAEYIDVA